MLQPCGIQLDIDRIIFACFGFNGRSTHVRSSQVHTRYILVTEGCEVGSQLVGPD